MPIPIAIAIAALSLLVPQPLSRAQAPEKTGQAVRQRFVSQPQDPAGGNGASFSALHQLAADKAGILMLMAHAGIGDSFPVAEEGQPRIFEIAVVAGDDDHLKLEIRAAAGTQQLDLKRDGTVSVQIAGHKFTVSYPSITVNPHGGQTTDKAMILVNRFP